MKKTVLLLSAALLSLAALHSCNEGFDKESAADGQVVTFTATMGDDATRTQVSGNQILWSPGDEISIFVDDTYPCSKFTSTNAEPAATVDFSGYLNGLEPDGIKTFYALYPYYENAGSYDNGTIYFYMPKKQNAVAGSYDPAAFISVARSKDSNLRFYNVCGGVKLQFPAGCESWKSVIFHANGGEMICGSASAEVNLDDNGVPTSIEQWEDCCDATLLPPSEGFKSGTDYYMPLLFNNLKRGFSLIIDDGSRTGVAKYGTPREIKRSVFGILNVAAGDIEWKVSGSSDPVDLSTIEKQWYCAEFDHYLDIGVTSPGKIIFTEKGKKFDESNVIDSYSISRNILGNIDIKNKDGYSNFELFEVHPDRMVLRIYFREYTFTLCNPAVNLEVNRFMMEIDGKTFPIWQSSSDDSMFGKMKAMVDGFGGNVPFVYLNSYGKPADYAGKNVTGKVVFVNRGEINFQEKVKNAADAGAVGVIIVDNNGNGSPLYMSVGAQTGIPSGAVPLAAASYLSGKTSVRIFVPSPGEYLQ